MNKELLEQRVKDIQAAIDQSAANHNALMGRLEEAKFVLSQFKEPEEPEEPEENQPVPVAE